MEDEEIDTRKRRHRKKAKVDKAEEPQSQPPPSSPLELPSMESEAEVEESEPVIIENQDTVPGRLYLCQIHDQPNMLVIAVDDEHAKELVWSKLHKKPEVRVTSISLFEPSIRFIQSPDKVNVISNAQRLKPYTVFICMDHTFWDRPGCVIVADSDLEAESIVDSFFKENYIIGEHSDLEQLSLANHRVYY